MQYMGSKKKIAKDIIPIILKNRQKDQYYAEPFCGGCNSIELVDGPRIAGDSHYYLIQMWRALKNGWEPPNSLSQDEYKDIKQNLDRDPALSGFVGFLCSFGGKWWGGYAQNRKNDNYCLRGKRSVLKQIKNLQNTHFIHAEYDKLAYPLNSIIYCDIPYKNTVNYKDKFDHDKFWTWAQEMSNEHDLYVSEYSAPAGWICVWSKEVKSTLNKNEKQKKIEKLFVYKG